MPINLTRILLVLTLSFFTKQACAQYDDTTAVYDTAYTPPAVDLDDDDDYYSDEDQEPYFLDLSGTIPDSIRTRQVPPDKIKSLKAQDDFWYADAVLEKKEEKVKKSATYTPLGQREWFKTLIWLVIIASFAAVLMMYLSSSNVGLFRRKPAKVTDESGEEEMPEDIFAINYQREIDKAAAQGNFRLAVRLMYLRLLKKLSERNIINYTQDKTNFDYLLQLHPTAYYKDFFRITRHYEYSWYGQFSVSEEAYGFIRKDVDQFEREIK